MKIGEAAAMIGSTPATLRRWEETGDLKPAWKTKGGTRYYSIVDINAICKDQQLNVKLVKDT